MSKNERIPEAVYVGSNKIDNHLLEKLADSGVVGAFFHGVLMLLMNWNFGVHYLIAFSLSTFLIS